MFREHKTYVNYWQIVYDIECLKVQLKYKF